MDIPQIPNLIHYAIPAFVGLLLLETVVGARMQRDWYEIKDTASSLAMGIGNVLINLLVKGLVIGAYYLVYQLRLFDLGWAAWVWVLGFVAEDFSYYWFHRKSHEIRYFWASHVVHHSSQKYNLGTALRQTWTGGVSGSFVFWLWMPLLGFHPVMIATLQSISLLYQFWIHTEAIDRLPPPIEWLFNTPSHHRVHHGSDPKYLDRNHGGILIIWDRLFGTFQAEEERPTYGLTKNIQTFHPLQIATHEWQDMIRDLWQHPRYAWSYLFGPPGWRHDGPSQTAQHLREEVKHEDKAF